MLNNLRFLRAVELVGWAILVVAVPFLIFAPHSRPKLHVLLVAVGIGALLGLVSGLVFRYFVPLERRLQIFRSLSPRLARRLMPAGKDSEGTP